MLFFRIRNNSCKKYIKKKEIIVVSYSMLPGVHQLVVIICTIISLSLKSPFIHSLSVIEYIYWEMVLKYLGKSSEWKWKPFSRACCLWSHRRSPLVIPTGVGSHSLFQGIFPTQGSNPCLLHCRQFLYHCHQVNPLYSLLNNKDISPTACMNPKIFTLNESSQTKKRI